MTRRRVYITGIGIVSSIGSNVAEFGDSLLVGRSGIRQTNRNYIGAVLDDFKFTDAVGERAGTASGVAERAIRAARRSPKYVQAGVLSSLEAWRSAGFEGTAASDSTGLLIAGNNTTSSFCFEQTQTYLECPQKVLPSYAMHCLDTDHLGTISEVLGITGPGYGVGAASASGGVAVTEGFEQIASGRMDACVVAAPPVALSAIDMHALRGLGAALPDTHSEHPDQACRPFDEDRQGFVPGEAAATVVLECEDQARSRGARPIAEIAGCATCLGASRMPTPSQSNESRAMLLALSRSGLDASAIDYVNAHATASRAGDEAELRAIECVLGDRAPQVWVNSTKSLTGHSLQAAGVVELIAVLVQMTSGSVHPNLNLQRPLRTDCRLVPGTRQKAQIRTAMSNSFGFGGIACSIVVRI